MLTIAFARSNFGGWIAPEVIDGKNYNANAVDGECNACYPSMIYLKPTNCLDTSLA